MSKFKDLGFFVKVDQQNPPDAIQFDLQNEQKMKHEQQNMVRKNTHTTMHTQFNTQTTMKQRDVIEKTGVVRQGM